MMADRADSLMDQVFAAVSLPTVGQNTIVESHHEESHFHSESHHHESQHHEHVEYTTSGVTVGNVFGGHEDHHRPIDNDDQQSEVSAISKATSVSVHSSVSQKSAQQYDLPPLPKYDLPPMVIDSTVVGKAPSVASSKSGSRHSAASHHSHHSHHSVHSAHTHDSESTITEGTLVNEPVAVGGFVGSEAPTPVVVGQSFEHDAVIEQFKNLHGKEPSVVSSLVPATVHMQSDSEDSIAPSKLTHSIQVGGVFGSSNGIDVLHRSHDLSYTDLVAPEYYQAPSVQDGFDARSEDSFGFEKVEYVEQHHEPEPVKQVVHEHVIEQQTYDPYHIVHENHNVPSVDFEEDHHSTHEHHHHHAHHDSHVTHTFTTDVKQSRSNSASTYQSRHMFAHNVGPKITEELRPAVVQEEDETHVEPPVMAYVAPIPVKPPRTHEESHIYNAYESDNQHHHYHDVEVVKSTTIVQEDIRSGSQGIQHRIDSPTFELIGVSALRAKFEHGAPPPLAPVLEMKKHEEIHYHHHTHHEAPVEHVQVGHHFTTVENHYDVPFESLEKSSSSSSCSSSSSVVSSPQVVYDTPTIENLSHLPVYQEKKQNSVSSASHLYDTPVFDNYPHSPAFYKDDQHHHYVPQIKVITEYRHINPRHHYVETRVKKTDEVAHSPQVQSVDYFKEIDRVHHFVPSTPTSPTKEVRNTFHHHSYVPNSLETKRESHSVERVHHYLPENPTTVIEDRKIIREHNYVPLEKRSKSVETTVNHHHNYVPLVAKEEHHHQQINRDHQYVPLEKKQEVVKTDVHHDHHFVPLVQKHAEETVQVVREHNYIPLNVEKVQKTEHADWHNQYVPLTGSKTVEAKKFDAGRSHSYIPLGEDIKVSKPVILREHNYVPLVEKKVEQSGSIDHQHHNYLPAHSNVTVNDTAVINREHSFVPLANKVVEAPRHSNALSHHHYVPLPTKRNESATANGDKVGYEHHYFPLAPKTEQTSVHAGQEHHYVPLVPKTSEVSNVTHQHQYIPLTMKQEGVPRLPREHNYIPLATHTDSHEKVNLEHHQYLPPVTHAEKKEAVILYEHQYVPLPPKQESHAVRKIEGKEHHYVPLVQNYAAVRPPQLPREHHYFPLAVREEQHQKAVYEHHNYIPPVQRQQNHQPLDRQHGYLPLAKRQEDKTQILYQHQYIPAVKKSEQTNGYNRNHQYIPVGRNVAKEQTQDTEHHYVPQASPRKQTLHTEKVSSHLQLGGSRKSTIQSEHHHHDHHHHHHEKHADVPSRPSSVASSVKHQPHSRTSTVSTIKATPVQRVQPTIQPVNKNPYGDHQSVRVVKNVREYVTVFGATHKTPPPTPLAGIPRLSNNSARSPISHETFEPVAQNHSVHSSRKSSVVSIGNGVQMNGASRKSSVASCQSSRKSTASNCHDSVVIGGNVLVPRSRQSTITKDNVQDHYDELIRVSEMRRLFENYGPAHLPEYASSPSAYIH